MAVTVSTVPHFRKGQAVKFVGGVGTVKSHYLNSSTWTYLVEMAMGPEPEMGRVGYETTLLLNEADLALQTTAVVPEWSMSV
jgi:hypothetical protein